MVIDMDETRLRTIEQLEEFLRATPEVAFTAHDAGGAADNQRNECPSEGLSLPFLGNSPRADAVTLPRMGPVGISYPVSYPVQVALRIVVSNALFPSPWHPEHGTRRV